MALLSKNLGIDLGTVNVLIYEGGQIVLQEPSLVAVTAEEDERGRIDVLVCTMIIESGIDIPNANTLIVNNAHWFGLSEML